MRSSVLVSSLVVCFGLDMGGCGGCNDSNSAGRLPDASPGPADAMPPDAVSLAVINHGVPAVGVTVYFLDADGSVASAAVTDGNGIASAVITAGGSVTAIRPFTTPPPPAGAFAPDELRTFLGVKPGDHLVLSRAATDAVTVAFDLATPDGGDPDTGYQLFTTCGGGPTPIAPGGDPVNLQNCHGAADIAVVASGGGLDAPVGLYHANASLPPDGDVMVSLQDDAYASATDFLFTYTSTSDAPILVQHSPVLPNGFLGPSSATADDTTDNSATLTEAAVPAEMEVVDSSLTLNNQHEVIDWGPYSTSYALDVGSTLLREVTGAATYDLATGKISWTEATSGVTPSLTVAGILVTRPDPFARWHWEIVAPYSPSGIVLPRLPSDVFDWKPGPNDQIESLDPIQNVQVTGGYDAVRAHILDIHDETGPTGYVIGNAGRAVIATYLPPLQQPQRLRRPRAP
ncbi:MAG TPA: hypothetical protein VHT91_46665 [Kofleriaceae bacterium]|nr:hypothetical protein [Kofleriaceae bacterium]